MQALLSMMSSVAGFTAPYFIAGCVLRTKEELDAARDEHVLNGLAFIAPLLSVITLFGLNTVQDELNYEEKAKQEEDPDCLTGIPIERAEDRDCLVTPAAAAGGGCGGGGVDLVGESFPLLGKNKNVDDDDTGTRDDKLSDSSDGEGLSMHGSGDASSPSDADRSTADCDCGV